MYIEKTISGYDRSGQQVCRRARFLILMQDKDAPLTSTSTRAIVRKVALHQFGPWMMGYARIHGKTITMSGSYGSDGLPCNVDKATFEKGIPLPAHLYDLWDKGGGWNSCGSEAEEMAKWANSVFPAKKEKLNGYRR